MYDGVFLDIGPVADLDIPEIPSQDRARPYVTIFSDGHTADENGGRMDKRGFSDSGSLAFKLVKRHDKILSRNGAIQLMAI